MISNSLGEQMQLILILDIQCTDQVTQIQEQVYINQTG